MSQRSPSKRALQKLKPTGSERCGACVLKAVFKTHCIKQQPMLPLHALYCGVVRIVQRGNVEEQQQPMRWRAEDCSRETTQTSIDYKLGQCAMLPKGDAEPWSQDFHGFCGLGVA